MKLEHLVRNHFLVCPNCNWLGTYEEAAFRYVQNEQLGAGKALYEGGWGEPICVNCACADWSSQLMPTETNPDSMCNCIIAGRTNNT
jgi:hypothetical protein